MDNVLWTKNIGVLPVDFLHNQALDVKVSALLNGATHNFCVGYDYGEVDSLEFRSKAWSANMSTYMYVQDDNVYLYDWYRNIEKIKLYEVERNISRFYAYLSTKKIEKQDSVLELVLNQFKIIRSTLREEGSAQHSLSILLYLLSRLDNSNTMTWHLPDNAENVALSLDNSFFDESVSYLKRGLKKFDVTPEVDMILRHCSGALFQEANYIAQFPQQLSLFPSYDYLTEKNPNLVGAYFTPSHIARSIVEETLRGANLRKDRIIVFDPSCGSGVFLSECLRQLRSIGYKGHVSVLGWDIEQTAVDMTNFVLGFEKNEWNGQMDYCVSKNDSLCSENIWPKADIILMNPPYISWGMMSEKQRIQMRDLLGDSNKPNMSVAFYYLAANALLEHGVMGCLVPSSVLSADSAAEVRRYVNEKAHPILVGQLGNFVFTSAYVDVCMIVAQNASEHDEIDFLWTKNLANVSDSALRCLRRSRYGGDAEADNVNLYSASYEDSVRRDAWLPQSRESLMLMSGLEYGINRRVLKRAEVLFDIRQGARTGKNDVFTLSRRQYLLLPNRERKYFRPSVDNDAIQDGALAAVNYIFFPYPDSSFPIKDEVDLASKLPVYYRSYLLPQKDILKSRSGINSEKWWLLTRPRNWQFDKQIKLVSTEFGRSGSYSIDETGEFVVERGLCFFPVDHPMNLEELCFYLMIFNSTFFDKLLSIYSRQLAGGAYNLESKFIKEIPLPIYDAIDTYSRDILSSAGKRMLASLTFDNERVESIIDNLYGAKYSYNC